MTAQAMTAGARLLIEPGAYRLHHRGGEWIELAVLGGGSNALLPGNAPMREPQLERAIEVAEDWVMPHAHTLQGEQLEVLDVAGGLEERLMQADGEAPSEWQVDEIETLFLRHVNRTLRDSHGSRAPDKRGQMADVLLLRELAHHAKLRAILMV